MDPQLMERLHQRVLERRSIRGYNQPPRNILNLTYATPVRPTPNTVMIPDDAVPLRFQDPVTGEFFDIRDFLR
jgi:hypothetical protein